MDKLRGTNLAKLGMVAGCLALAACSNSSNKQASKAPEKRPSAEVLLSDATTQNAPGETATEGVQSTKNMEVALVSPDKQDKAHISNNTKFSSRAYGVDGSPRVTDSMRVKKGGGRYHVGKPYTIRGIRYYPKEDPNYRAVGLASWYGPNFHGRLTANGEIYDQYSLSAAHPTMPLPSYAKVTNLENGASVMVRVNDRGPFSRGRIIDLSSRAAQLLGYTKKGVAKVKVEYAGKARMDGLDEPYLVASYDPGTLDPNLIPPNPAGSVQLAAASRSQTGKPKRKTLESFDNGRFTLGGRDEPARAFTGHPVDVSALKSPRPSSLVNGFMPSATASSGNPFEQFDRLEPILPPSTGMGQVARLVVGPIAESENVDVLETALSNYGPVTRLAESPEGHQNFLLTFIGEDRPEISEYLDLKGLNYRSQ